MATKKKPGKNAGNLVNMMRDLIDGIRSKQLSEYFRRPVDEKADYAPNYYVIIKEPMCLN
jgi:hypothetical protein